MNGAIALSGIVLISSLIFTGVMIMGGMYKAYRVFLGRRALRMDVEPRTVPDRRPARTDRDPYPWPRPRPGKYKVGP